MKIRRFFGFRRFTVPEQFETVEGNWTDGNHHVAIITRVIGSRHWWSWHWRWVGGGRD